MWETIRNPSEGSLRNLPQKNVFVHNESGFRKQHSCETVLQLIVSDWMKFIVKKNAVVIETIIKLV